MANEESKNRGGETKCKECAVLERKHISCHIAVTNNLPFVLSLSWQLYYANVELYHMVEHAKI